MPVRVAASFLLCLLFLMSGASAADPVPTPKPILFARGASQGTVEGNVLRGERDLYSITAGAGQAMTVTITAPEGNAAFQIYEPGSRIARDKDGILEVAGNALRGAGETDDANRWAGRLPRGGAYLVVIGSTRGNAGYTLLVKIE